MTDHCDEADGTCVGGIVLHHDDYASSVTRPMCRRHHKLWHDRYGRAPNWTKKRRDRSKTGIQITVSMPPNEAAAITELARQNRRSVSQMIREAVLLLIAKEKAA